MSTTIIFVRHADVHNPDDILYGRLPRFGLSKQGRKQAQVTAGVLAHTPVTVFYTSPLLRARQTTRILAAEHPGVPIHKTRLLNEVLTGWQGQPHASLEEIGFNFYDHPKNPDDEGLEQIWGRIERFVQMIRRRYGGGTVVAVTHGDVFALARAGYRGLPIELGSIRLPHPYPGKGGLLRLTFEREGTYPMSEEYYDPNGDDPQWSSGWVELARDEQAA